MDQEYQDQEDKLLKNLLKNYKNNDDICPTVKKLISHNYTIEDIENYIFASIQEPCTQQQLQLFNNNFESLTPENINKRCSGNTLLTLSIKDNELSTSKYLISKGADINKPDIHGMTPLHLAIHKDNDFDLNFVKFLVDHGANVNAQDKEGNTPLHYINEDNYEICIQYLEEKGADIYKPNNDGITVKKMVQFIKKQQLQQLHKQQLRKQQQLHEDINKIYNGNTLLTLSIIENELLTSKDLIEKGADINKPNKYGKTPLHLAIDKDDDFDLNFVKFLVDHGANVNAQDNEGNTPLHYINKDDYEKCIQYLVEKGADINKPNNNGITVKFMVQNFKKKQLKQLREQQLRKQQQYYEKIVKQIKNENTNIEIIENLILEGADPNYQKSRNLSLLEYAVHFDKNDVVDLLLNYGANYKKPEIIKKAIRNKLHDIVETFLKDEERREYMQKLPLLHYSIENMDIEMITILLDNGFSPNFKWDNKTPIEYIKEISKNPYYGASIEDFHDKRKQIIKLITQRIKERYV